MAGKIFRRMRRFWRRDTVRMVRVWVALLALDFLVIFLTAGWWTGVFMWMRFYHLAAFLLLLRWRRFDRLLPVRVVYSFCALLFIGTIIFSFFPLRCVSVPALAVSLCGVPLAAVYFARRVGVGARAAAFAFVPAAVVSLLVVGPANKPLKSSECDDVRKNPDIEILVDVPAIGEYRGLPRFMAYREDRNDLIITYRVPYGPIGKLPANADRFDIATRTVHPIRAITDDPIGLYYDQPRGQVFIVTANKFNHEHPKTLVVLDADLEVKAVVDFPQGEDDDYTAHMMPYGDRVAVRAEGEGLYVIDPVTYEIEIADPFDLGKVMRGCRLFDDTGFLHIPPDRFIISGVIDPVVYTLAQAHGICSYDLEEKNFTRAVRTPLNGTWDIAYAPDRNEVIGTSAWRSLLYVVDATTLELKRTLSVGSCLRPVAYDPASGRGYTAECFSGWLDAFDVETGEVTRRTQVGRNARKIYVIDGLGTIVLTGCGVLRLKTDELQ